MRTSVLAGLFACTLIFIGNANKAEAMEIATEKTNETTSLVKIESMNESPKSPLLSLNEVKIEDTLPVEDKIMIIHTVAQNETLSAIAEQYQTTWERIYSKNTQIENPNIVNVGELLTIPEANEELQPREVPVVEPVVAKKKPTSSTNKAEVNYPRASVDGNGYVAGYCTWYVKNQRPDLPNNLGNASTWVSRAASQGIATGSEPRVGAVGQRNNHVVYVLSVNGDGTITISDMNYQARYVITTRTVPASQFTYIY
jgi:surface antigen